MSVGTPQSKTQMNKNRKKEFTGSLRQYNITFRMKEDIEPLWICVENRESFQRWSIIIDKQFINDQNTIFRDTFSSAKRLFDFLVQNFNKIIIENGSFRFEYGIINRKPITVCIKLLKQDIQKFSLAQLKISRLEEKVIKTNKQLLRQAALVGLICFFFVFLAFQGLKQKEEFIQELVISQMEYRSNISLLISHQQELKGQIEKNLLEQQSNKVLLLQQLQTFQKQLNQLTKDQQNKWNKDRIQITALLHKNEQLALRQTKMEDKHTSDVKQLIGQLGIIDKIGHHPNNSLKNYFSVTPTSTKSAKILKTGSYGWHNFVNKLAILPQMGGIKYRVKIGKSLNTKLIGFTAEKGLGNIDNYKSSESAYYQNYLNGNLWAQGQLKTLQASPVRIGDIVEVGVNFVTGKFYWLKGETKLAECSIPASMKNKPIYLSILIHYENEDVEVFA